MCTLLRQPVIPLGRSLDHSTPIWWSYVPELCVPARAPTSASTAEIRESDSEAGVLCVDKAVLAPNSQAPFVPHNSSLVSLDNAQKDAGEP